jgi:hypothetical protein
MFFRVLYRACVRARTRVRMGKTFTTFTNPVDPIGFIADFAVNVGFQTFTNIHNIHR